MLENIENSKNRLCRSARVTSAPFPAGGLRTRGLIQVIAGEELGVGKGGAPPELEFRCVP